jgi:long-chain acyl-CoA synthetase
MQAAGSTLSTKPSAQTIARSAATAAERYGDRPALRHRSGDGWAEVTFAEAAVVVEEAALGLLTLGVEPGDRVCLLANTRVEWTYASLAISSTGCVVVPVYPTNAPEECEWVAGNSEARVIVCEDASQVAKITQVRDALPALEAIVVIDGPAGDADLTLDDLRAQGRDQGDPDELARRRDAVTPEDRCFIVYTSGTTGPPKGTVLTHGNCSSVGAMVQEIGFVTEEDVSYLYLPLAHVFALTVQIASFDVGTAIIFFGGDPKKIIAELAETKPTYFPSVPRIFEKIFTMATSAVEQAPAEDQVKFAKAIEIGFQVRELERDGRPVPERLRAAYEEADTGVFANVRALFGGRLRQAVSGAAPIAPEILRFFVACGVMVLEGYGMTETTAVGCVGTLEHWRIGTVGRPMPGVEVRIAEDGEIQMRGPNIFKEYWRNPEATAETFTEDGWLMTGDLGTLDEDGYLSITGRKKDIIITAGGKNLAPANVENDLKQSRWISQAVMFGDRKPYPVALITLDPEELVPWAREHGLPEDVTALGEDETVRALIQDELDRVNAKYARVEQVKRFAILPRDLSQESGELTPTLKVKRNVVYERHADVFEGLYR